VLIPGLLRSFSGFLGRFEGLKAPVVGSWLRTIEKAARGGLFFFFYLKFSVSG
jgi:hypothetical protein